MSSGLGLILCKEFIERLNGKLIIESEPEKGSVFTMLLPLAND
ncbi:MAG: ATP-binding protein [Bacteroidales bacterium]